MNQSLPNLIIAGVTKAGTTSLFTYLTAHPDVCSSSIKEVAYFLPLRWGQDLAPLSDYRRYFNHCERRRFIMEASASYFFGAEAVSSKIHEILKGVRIIVMFRDPVARLYSFFNYHQNMLNIDSEMTFTDYIKKCESFTDHDFKKEENYYYYGLSNGRYVTFIEPWIKNFGNDINFYFFEDLKNDQHFFMKEICNWLEIDDSYYDNYEFVIENKTRNYKFKGLQKIALAVNLKCEKIFRKYIYLKRYLRSFYYFLNEGARKSIKMTEEERLYLQKYYRPYNQKLRDVLQSHGIKRLPSWLTD